MEATLVERFLIGCAGEFFGAFTREEMESENWGDSTIEPVFIPSDELDAYMMLAEVLKGDSGKIVDLTIFNTASLDYMEAVEKMKGIEQRGRELKKELEAKQEEKSITFYWFPWDGPTVTVIERDGRFLDIRKGWGTAEGWTNDFLALEIVDERVIAELVEVSESEIREIFTDDQIAGIVTARIIY